MKLQSSLGTSCRHHSSMHLLQGTLITSLPPFLAPQPTNCSFFPLSPTNAGTHSNRQLPLYFQNTTTLPQQPLLQRHSIRSNYRPSSSCPIILATATAAADDVPMQPDTTAVNQQNVTTFTHFISSLYRFTRPHTMLGTFVSVVSVSMLAIGPEGLANVAASTALAQALVSALFMNICIVGINQLYDVEIDRINKPYLPLAAGDFSMVTGQAIVLITGIASLIVGALSGSQPLIATLVGSLLLGIGYSTDLPFLRWKRYPVAAASCILAVRAVLVQLGFFFHMQLALGAATPEITRPVAFATAFMFIFSIVIALFKDIPDIRGDSKAGLQTLSVRLGPQTVFWVCIGLLEVAYIMAVVVGLQSQYVWSRVATTVCHVGMSGLIYWRALNTDLKSSKSIYSCYMDVWKAFYVEYLLLPLFR